MTTDAGISRISPEKLVDSAEMAIASEIEAVRERPSTEVLHDGKKVKNPAADEVHYRFETNNPSLRFAEECQAAMPDESVTVYPVETGEEAIVFRFPKDYGTSIYEVELEWENDFVLRRIQESLIDLLDDPDRRDRIKKMIVPESADHRDEQETISEDGFRNAAQREAVDKAMCQPVSYIWGPPGTGKTAILGYVMANYVLLGKSVLFVSNTNRAVDNGMLGLMDAMETMEMKGITSRITRFGERILESKRLDRIHFDQQLEEVMQKQLREAADLQHWLDALDLPDLSPDQKKHISQKLERLGGVEAVEEQIQELTQKDRFAFSRLRRYKVLGTTLARVCTSEMLESMEFDAVVVDEASMAGIPYMLVMASKAKEHLVIAGDPMQLPPIAITPDPQSRRILEQDIFAVASGAESTDELFQWHDDHPGFTSFFNIQYRMQSDLARVISEVFYEGRLISPNEASHSESVAKPGNGTLADSKEQTEKNLAYISDEQQSSNSVALLDSSSMSPVLRQQKNRKGFQPVNDVHVTLLEDIVTRLLMETHAGLHEIGIIVPFRSTVWHLRRELRGKKRWYDLEIGTIHTFQGREKKVIILDTVMSGEPQGGSRRHYSVRPFDEAKNGLSVPRLLNVAFSRSKERLVVIADMEHIRRVYGKKFLGKLLERLPRLPYSSF